ncbi:hypothetical protein F5882DRAFT_376764 [Hyaloscypha sp. PMI_1271]|nr:hypothetical protein F5882DRAFT_376764 [Hyaloscypha sp. PMI_1271]
MTCSPPRARSRELSELRSSTIAMQISTLSAAVSLLGLGLAHNETGPGMRFWNATTAQLATASSGLSAVTNGPFIEETATIQIQISNLSGSGVIKLSNISITSEASKLSDLLNPTSFTNQSHQTEAPSSQTTFCPPNTTATFPYRGTSARNFNATMKDPTAQPSVGSTPLTSPIFTGSGSPKSAGLPKIPATLLALIFQIAIMSFL